MRYRLLAADLDGTLVTDDKRGKWIYYEMNLSVLDEITGWLASLKGETGDEE